MSSPEYHSSQDWDDPPPSPPSLHPDPNGVDNEMGDSDSPQILEIDYITIPTLGTLGMRRNDYQTFPEEQSVMRCEREITREGGLWYSTVFADGHTDVVPFEKLLTLDGGPEALESFGSDNGGASTRSLNNGRTATAVTSDDDEGRNVKGKALNLDSTNRRPHRRGTSLLTQQEDDSDAPLSLNSTSLPTRELRRRKVANLAENRKAQLQEDSSPSPSPSDDELDQGRRTRSQPLRRVAMLPYRRQSHGHSVHYDSGDDLVVSDLVQYTKRPSRPSTRASNRRKHIPIDSDFSDAEPDTRKSGRTTTKRNLYTEPGLDDDFMEIDSVPLKPTKPRVVHAKEIFPTLDEDGPFAQFHSDTCDTCGDVGPSRSRGVLVYCQGCSYAYHVDCIGNRAAREHLVTKVDEDDFVLQCRRCIGRPRRKDPTAPHTDRCVECRTVGTSCSPFRDLKKPKSGTPTDASAAPTPDPDIPREFLYSAENLLFRCSTCRRAWHYDHLPPLTTDSRRKSTLTTTELRLAEYAPEAKCIECTTHPDKIHLIRAWRPADAATREVNLPETIDIADFSEDEREYLVKFVETSYFRAEWLPASWVWGAHQFMRTGFVKKGPMLAYTTEQAVPEPYLRVEIVFDVRYSSIVPTGEDMEVDLKRIGEVTEAMVKFQGLGYDDVVWEVPPADNSNVERWADWKRAYEDYVHGNYVRLPRNTAKKQAVARGKTFEGKLEKKVQPGYIQGGTLMKYQMEGLNWLYYKWYRSQTAILADEMGLGKTIQVISFLAVMVNDLNLWPFLIVVPHSTVPNWKREISHWCPSMRVVAYFGADKARQLQRKYEMFHRGGSGRDLKCHIVVASYTTPLTDSQYLKNVPWEALIVDEGQRLKNDQSLLYKALEGYRFKHKVLMTGTPLQNNPRELFNLLHFLDPKLNAQDLEEEFGELTRENVPRLHEMIRPFFLRRTKKEVLTFLPPMAEVIVPVTMSSLQKKLYKSILAKDPGLIKSIFRNPGDKAKAGNLKNVLMQLRKVLGHPFFYSDDIEDRSFDGTTLHQNLVEAGSKFELLNIMLPKLKERGHRVLMFSQFLGMLDVMEDFLAGLGLNYQRLDGMTNTQEKQRRIDAFNAPGSKDFAFLLSTRAGGVGINLATADTVIILDPDFNPHQDIQALSRAHRIGQKNKVLVFHLVTRDTAEEKIMQIGKKKLSLDHLIIEKMGAEGDEEEQVDVESVLKFGARALFEDEGDNADEKRIRYDSDGVDRLLDRSTIEETKTTEVAGAENAFSFARVWANEKGTLEEGMLGDDASDADMDMGFWDKLLAEREEQARAAAAKAAEELGRGKRKKKVDYSLPQDEYNDTSPVKGKGKNSILGDAESADEDFRAEEDETESDGAVEEGVDPMELDFQRKAETMRYQDMAIPTTNRTSQHLPVHLHKSSDPPPLPVSQPQFAPAPTAPMTYQPRRTGPRSTDRNYLPITITSPSNIPGSTTQCRACTKLHPPGQCPLKTMGVEYCPLCGLAHFGKGPICPSLADEENITAMLRALRDSNEDPEMVKDAKSYLRGRKGALRRVAAARNPNGREVPYAGE